MSEERPREDAPGEHDAWLRQALRHAPDATVAPPSALREAILAEARAAVRAGRAAAPGASFADRLAGFWSWLARPPVAAGFASVMAATLVGMMWWDRPMDTSLAPPPAAHATRSEATAPPPSAAPTPNDAMPATGQAATSPAVPAPTTRSSVAAEKRETLAKAAATGNAEDKQRKDQALARAMPSAPVVSPFPATAANESAANAPQAAAPASAKKEDAEATADAAPQRPRSIAPEPSPAEKPAEAARSPDATTADTQAANAIGGSMKSAPLARQGAATAPRGAADALAQTPGSSPPTAPTAAQPVPPAPIPAMAPQAFGTAPSPLRDSRIAGERRAAGGATATPPIAALLGSLSGNPGHWARSLANGGSAPLSSAAQAWLASVDAATAGRWQAAAAERRGRLQGALDGDAGKLALSRDGKLAATVRIEDAGVFFEGESGDAWFAPLPAEALASLRRSLPPIGR